MDERFAGKVAVVTGAASGIGFGIASALVAAGAHVAVADIRFDAIERAAAALARPNVAVRAYEVDVALDGDVERFAARVEADFGGVDLLFNNAGVAYPGIPIERAPAGDIAWVFGVNVFGIVNGIRAFVPRMRRRAAGGHIVNTSSYAGLAVMAGWHQGIYAATKMAVVGLSEGLRDDVADAGIGVSVLCPAAVATELYDTSVSETVRSPRYGDSIDRNPPPERRAAIARGLDPHAVGTSVLDAIRHGDFYIITHPEMHEAVESRHRAISAAFASAARRGGAAHFGVTR